MLAVHMLALDVLLENDEVLDSADESVDSSRHQCPSCQNAAPAAKTEHKEQRPSQQPKERRPASPTCWLCAVTTPTTISTAAPARHTLLGERSTSSLSLQRPRMS